MTLNCIFILYCTKIIWDQYKFNDYNNNIYLIGKCSEINDMNIIES